MATVNGLDAFKFPQVALPEDMGDGPFLMNAPNPTSDRPAMANTETLFSREEPFEENWLTDMPIFGKSDFISTGRIYINDLIPPNSFRRVNQHFRLESVRNLSGIPTIVFQGGSIAIIEEGLGAIAPSPVGSLAAALDSLSTAEMVVRPTLPVASTTFHIRFRLPGFEPDGLFMTAPPSEVLCIDPRVPSAQRLLAANTIDEFNF